MANIKLSRLGLKGNKVYTGSELLFLYSLSRYTKEVMNKDLDLSEIDIAPELLKSSYFSFVYSEGINFGLKIADKDIVDYSDIDRLSFKSDLTGVKFEKQTDKEWVYKLTTDSAANSILNQYNKSAGYLALLAYVTVVYAKKNKKRPILHIINTEHKQDELEYVDLLVLTNYGNKWLEESVKIDFSALTVVQPEWEAHLMYYEQLGYRDIVYTKYDKEKFVKKNLKVGDVVLVYKTAKPVKYKRTRRLQSCNPAVIRGIDKNLVVIEQYSNINTLLTYKREIESAEEKFDGYKYTVEEIEKFPSFINSFSYLDFGIEHIFNAEEIYILKAQDGRDVFSEHLVDSNGVEGVYTMGALDKIYAVFEDRGVSYDKEHFLLTHFKNKKPIYDKVLGR